MGHAICSFEIGFLQIISIDLMPPPLDGEAHKSLPPLFNGRLGNELIVLQIAGVVEQDICRTAECLLYLSVEILDLRLIDNVGFDRQDGG